MKPFVIKEVKTIPSSFWQKREWYVKRFSWYLHTLYPQGLSFACLGHRRFSFMYKWGASFAGENADWFSDQSELERVRRVVLKELHTSTAFADNVAADFFKEWKKFVQITKEAEKQDITTLTDEALYHWYEKLFWSEVSAASWGYITDSFLGSGASDWLSEIICQELNTKPEQLGLDIEKLTSPTFSTFINQEHEELLSLAVIMLDHEDLKKCIQRGKVKDVIHALQAHPKIMKKLTGHADKFYWIRNNYYHSFVLGPEHFVEELIAIGEHSSQLKKTLQEALEQRQQQCMRNREKKNMLLSRHKASPYLKNLVHTADLFTYVQDTRKQGVLRLNHFLFLFCDELARRRNISREEALYMIEPEIKDILLRKKVNRSVLQERMQKCFIYFDKNGYKILAGKNAEQIPREIFYEDYGNVKEIRGTVACAGEVTGVVKVVHNHEGIVLFKEGEILVTNNTTPEFVPALKKAKAVITEQGGITTHAAIISREFEIPCVVGTRIATKVLKDGDVVMVNATKGLITIIKRT